MLYPMYKGLQTFVESRFISDWEMHGSYQEAAIDHGCIYEVDKPTLIQTLGNLRSNKL